MRINEITGDPGFDSMMQKVQGFSYPFVLLHPTKDDTGIVLTDPRVQDVNTFGHVWDEVANDQAKSEFNYDLPVFCDDNMAPIENDNRLFKKLYPDVKNIVKMTLPEYIRLVQNLSQQTRTGQL